MGQSVRVQGHQGVPGQLRAAVHQPLQSGLHLPRLQRPDAAGMRVREAPRMLLDGLERPLRGDADQLLRRRRVAIRFSRAAFLHAICFRFSVLRAAVGHAVRDPDHLCDPVAFAVVHRALALFDAARGQRDKSRSSDIDGMGRGHIPSGCGLPFGLDLRSRGPVLLP